MTHLARRPPNKLNAAAQCDMATQALEDLTARVRCCMDNAHLFFGPQVKTMSDYPNNYVDIYWSCNWIDHGHDLGLCINLYYGPTGVSVCRVRCDQSKPCTDNVHFRDTVSFWTAAARCLPSLFDPRIYEEAHVMPTEYACESCGVCGKTDDAICPTRDVCYGRLVLFCKGAYILWIASQVLCRDVLRNIAGLMMRIIRQ
jgi:hypothetical protein